MNLYFSNLGIFLSSCEVTYYCIMRCKAPGESVLPWEWICLPGAVAL
ncbi:hypothetical protein HMPREF1250_1142 [Megasphaera vaginalis (ex Srinivasan et al. 2021)]|uniref:Uncharacterized protein n=1 Tax=Megasphaera vaginalis (ex Srinivasan et al. 2021) TaxID=1111454 RepID=U7UG07_9FIRM|nr:hypothetical protein HMPREF1250_1142 [Megasphaera vaginalis (ex Srinivasan et al. 2021)]